MNTNKLVDKILSEAKEFKAIPSNKDQAYILLVLAIGTAKRDDPAFNSVGNLPEKEQEEMIEAGEKVINGSMDAEAYIKKFEGALAKTIGKKVPMSDYSKEQLKARLELSKSPAQKNNGLVTNSNKEVKKK